jgi:uncharacterized protein DUF2637
VTGTRATRHGLLALTCAVAAVTFAISFHGLDGYGYHVMRLGRLAPLVPVGVDLASLVSLLAAHMRRADRWARRAYAWAVFAVTALLSVAGNLADGRARGLAPAGLVGVAMAPVVFVLVSHLAITSWRSVGPAPVPQGDLELPPPGPADPVTTPEPVPVSAPRRPARRQSAAERVAKAAARTPAATAAQLAARLGLSERTVQRHLPRPADDMVTTARQPSGQVNGAAVLDLVSGGATR